jgi:hypothetical protein
MKKEDIDWDALHETERLKNENERLKSLLEESKRADDSWDFKWDGRGSYEESRRCFYGDFS